LIGSDSSDRSGVERHRYRRVEGHRIFGVRPATKRPYRRGVEDDRHLPERIRELDLRIRLHSAERLGGDRARQSAGRGCGDADPISMLELLLDELIDLGRKCALHARRRPFAREIRIQGLREQRLKLGGESEVWVERCYRL
jgi:predicted metalloprotease